MSYLKQLKKVTEDKPVLPPEPKKRSGQFEEKYVYPEFSDEIPEDLESIELQIRKLDEKVWECAWLIGKRLSVIREKFLDQLGYQNISDYSKDKFGYSHTTTVRFIYLATNYDKSSVLNFGSKLYLLSKLKDSERQNYLEWMRNENPSYQAIEAKIKHDFAPPGRPKKEIRLNKTSITIDLRKMGVAIKKEKSEEFLLELQELIKKFSE